uniref:Uncharacterized protein n=1 Tax=Candidatus Kentrum sp. TUN TaxID=2126343 RepID=A0A450ZVY8_9GAMM|nr:MAG: hypothetical protein BECKTUN1418D_GA0071000_107115 [Candidatus Kentron sp. TUN]
MVSIKQLSLHHPKQLYILALRAEADRGFLAMRRFPPRSLLFRYMYKRVHGYHIRISVICLPDLMCNFLPRCYDRIAAWPRCVVAVSIFYLFPAQLRK